MVTQKSCSKAIFLIVFGLNSSLSVAASDWSTMLIEAGKKFLGTTLGKATLGVSAGVAAGYALHKYRTSRPVGWPELETYQGVPVNEDGVATLFVHGFGGTSWDAQGYLDILPGTIYTFDFPDAGELHISLAHTGLGQPVEVDHLERALLRLGSRQEIKKIIIFGVSRGGATVANLIKRANIPYKEKIAGFIIEQSFGRVQDILRDILNDLGLGSIPGSMTVAETVVKAKCNQYTSANQPVDNVDMATPEMKAKPVLITCSQEDRLIPYTSTVNLMRAFEEGGFSKLGWAIFPHGRHAELPWGDSHLAYRRVMQSFIIKALSDHNSYS